VGVARKRPNESRSTREDSTVVRRYWEWISHECHWGLKKKEKKTHEEIHLARNLRLPLLQYRPQRLDVLANTRRDKRLGDSPRDALRHRSVRFLQSLRAFVYD
jgi:hypothetical protein